MRSQNEQRTRRQPQPSRSWFGSGTSRGGAQLVAAASLFGAGCTLLYPTSDYASGTSSDPDAGDQALTDSDGAPDTESDGAPETDSAPKADGSSETDGAIVSRSAYAEAVLFDSPRAYLRLGESSGAVARDVGGAYDGAYQAVTLGVPGAIAGEADTAVHFDQKNAGVILGDVLDIGGGTPFALEVWAKPDVIDTVPRRILTKLTTPSPGTVGDGFSLIHQSTSYALTFEAWVDGKGGGKGYVSSPLDKGVYSHVVVSYDGVTLLFYVNGNRIVGYPTTINMTDNDARFVLGSLSSANGNTWQGDLDEFAIYDHDLPATRVKKHYDIGRGL